MPKLSKIFLTVYTFCAIIQINAQIFSWKNPNIPQDSIKKDSVIISRINKDFFTKDTLDFIKKQNRVVYDENGEIAERRSTAKPLALLTVPVRTVMPRD